MSSGLYDTGHMNTEEVLKSLQQWLQAGKENASRGNTPAGEGPPSEGAGGDTHETNHPKDPDAAPHGSLSRRSTARFLLLPGGRAVSYRLIQRRYTGAGSGCRATGLSSALWCIRGGIV
jgi:hypothetical protein